MAVKECEIDLIVEKEGGGGMGSTAAAGGVVEEGASELETYLSYQRLDRGSL